MNELKKNNLRGLRKLTKSRNRIGTSYHHSEIGIGCLLNIVFFPPIFNILQPLPRKDRAAIGCTENGQPIRVTVHSDQMS